jgi:alkanesulfonate monooxygenase SsuD/methylene tetrahydromethanopterin reductase-like flavin-dependent oxidoreductase (luciferase family)
MARHADGYVHGGGPPRAFARAAERARSAWVDCGRPGQPEILGQGYFALGGAAAAEEGARHLKRYYEFLGPFADKIAAGLLTTPQAVLQYVRSYEEAGCDELLLFATVPDLAELARLADVLGALVSPAAREIPA